MTNIPVIDCAELPRYANTDKSGPHGEIVAFLEKDEMAKVVKKNSKGLPYEFLMEIVARDRCGNDPRSNFILPIVSIYVTPKNMAISMPHMHQGDLYRLSKGIVQGDRKPPPLHTVYAIIRDFITAVCITHSCGMIHRDIKDANVLLKDNGAGSLLCDYSLATIFTHEAGNPFVPYTRGYRPPEIEKYEMCGTGHLDFFASDIYAAGSIAAKFLMIVSGEWMMYDTVPGLDDVVTSNSVSGNTKEMIVWMMQRRPSDRPTAAQIMQRMEWMRPEGYTAPRPFHTHAAPEVSHSLSMFVDNVCTETRVAVLAADIARTLPNTPEIRGKKKTMLCVALAVKMFDATEERDNLPGCFYYDGLISQFNEAVMHSPETLSALHRCVNCADPEKIL